MELDPVPNRRNGRGGRRPARWSNHKGTSGTRPPRICGVCGDKARSLHFGGLSCDSCKAFFRRAVQSTAYKNFQCPHQSAGWSQYCVINVTSRKSCQKCRFERCVQIGMEISWVMSEAERQRLLNARLAKRLKSESSEVPTTSNIPPPIFNKPLEDYLWPLNPEAVNIENIFTPEELESVKEVKTAWTNALQSLPPTPLEGVDLQQEIDHVLLVRSMTGSVQRFQNFAKPLLQAADMLDADKKTLLSASMLELCILRGALNHVRAATLYKRFFPARLHDIHCRFVKGLQEMSLDQTTLLIFLMVILMNPERPELMQPQDVEKIQEYYLAILNKYIHGRYGEMKATALYPKLLNKMADLRELSDCHQEQNLLIDQHQVRSMKLELSRIKHSDSAFEPPQKFVLNCLPPEQLSPEPYPTTSNGEYTPPPTEMTSPTSNYNKSPLVSSPCDSIMSSSSTHSFFAQSPPFTESSSDEFYTNMNSFEDKEQYFPPFLCLQSQDSEARINDELTNRPPLEFQQCCLPIQQKPTVLSSTSRCNFYDTPSETIYSMDKVGDDYPMLEEECQALVQQCLQDGTLLSLPTTSGLTESYSEYPTTLDYSNVQEQFIVSAYNNR